MSTIGPGLPLALPRAQNLAKANTAAPAPAPLPAKPAAPARPAALPTVKSNVLQRLQVGCAVGCGVAGTVLLAAIFCAVPAPLLIAAKVLAIGSVVGFFASVSDKL